MNLQQQARQCFNGENYGQAVDLYKQILEIDSTITASYWYLGLAYLLSDDETGAQSAWMLPIMASEDPEDIERLTSDLVQVLQQEAERQESLKYFTKAWVIRQYIREFHPSNFNNLLRLVQLAIKLKLFAEEELGYLEIIELLQSQEISLFDSDLLLQVLRDILSVEPFKSKSIDFIEACISRADKIPGLLNVVWNAAYRIGRVEGQYRFAVRLAELCLCLNPNDLRILPHLSAFYAFTNEYDKSVEMARTHLALSSNLPEQVFANHNLLQALMTTGGAWDEVASVFQDQKSLIRALIEENLHPLERHIALRLFVMAYPSPHLEDKPKQNKPIFNQLAQFCQLNIELYAKGQVDRYRQEIPKRSKFSIASRPLKIGYLSSCLRTHSVGWLARWLLQHHDPESFEIHAYALGHSSHSYDPLRNWYTQMVPHYHGGSLNGTEVAEQIYQDDIDILIDLDSSTLDAACEVMALKPAPVQATWLGFDASGLSTVDYFIADPYVLPESAQEYYTETIWRMPQTYLAVDGFEVGVPTLRRDQLEIPGNAVIYYSAQRGNKLHPETVRLQIKILREVENSYFLIKGRNDIESVKKFFTQIAEEEGVDPGRLRFIGRDSNEQVHRANLGIADVVLDTYPYNGATTTLETLWMGIPLVTRVGQQFAARNSYAFMINVGVTEGIAWTDEEYVEWGVRLGTDEKLRQQVAWKLKQSRQTSPLWNAKQFTREMEQAFQQMWARYVEG